MYYPMFKMTVKELENFVDALHNEQSCVFFCNKKTVLASTKKKLQKVFPPEFGQSLTLEGLLHDKVGSHEFFSEYRLLGKYQLRSRWVTRLLTYNKAPKHLKDLHKKYQGK